MNSVLLLQSSAWLFVITAAGGLVMAVIRFSQRGQNPPSWIAMMHGFLAAAGVTLLGFAALTVGIPNVALAGLALLLFSASAGVIMNLGYHIKDKALPKELVGIHAALAVAGFALVVWAAFGQQRP